MSSRYNDYDKGSSRSTRDDSRLYKDRREDRDGRESRKSRSRSPRRLPSPPASSSNRSPDSSDSYRYKERKESTKSYNKPSEWKGSDHEEVPAPPPPPRITKISMGFTKPKAPIKMNLGASSAKVTVAKPTVASVFNSDDDDDEPEEMPAEARMRMRNIGRETPTSAGPNSFGKTKQGFCDAKKVFEKNLKQQLETSDRPTMPKFPQTIYKIKGP